MMTLTFPKSLFGAAALALALALTTGTSTTLHAAPDLAPLDQWLSKQEQATSLKADFTQTRRMKTFNKPLISKGKLTFQAPENFRWEITDPKPSIAIFGAEKVTVLYPQLKRAEVMDTGDIRKSKWSDTFDLIKSGFPRSRKELERLFKIEGLVQQENGYELRLSLKKRSSENPVREARVYFQPETASIQATELELADGSLIRNDFRNVKINEGVSASAFEQTLPEGTQVTEPLK